MYKGEIFKFYLSGSSSLFVVMELGWKKGGKGKGSLGLGRNQTLLLLHPTFSDLF